MSLIVVVNTYIRAVLLRFIGLLYYFFPFHVSFCDGEIINYLISRYTVK